MLLSWKPLLRPGERTRVGTANRILASPCCSRSWRVSIVVGIGRPWILGTKLGFSVAPSSFLPRVPPPSPPARGEQGWRGRGGRAKRKCPNHTCAALLGMLWLGAEKQLPGQPTLPTIAQAGSHPASKSLPDPRLQKTHGPYAHSVLFPYQIGSWTLCFMVWPGMVQNGMGNLSQRRAYDPMRRLKP